MEKEAEQTETEEINQEIIPAVSQSFMINGSNCEVEEGVNS